jgi:hypothetical protein
MSITRSSSDISYVLAFGVPPEGAGPLDNLQYNAGLELLFGNPLIFTESDINSFFRLRDKFFSPDGATIEANLREGGRDVDFFEISGLLPGAFYEAQTVADPGMALEEFDNLDTILGEFDNEGNRVQFDQNSGLGLLSALTGFVPYDGALNLAVSGRNDFDFDGEDNLLGGPHGQVGDYNLVLRPFVLPMVTESDINSRFDIRDEFSAPDGAIVEAELLPNGRDVDFFEFSDLVAGTFFEAEVIFDFPAVAPVLGQFDGQGRLDNIDKTSFNGVKLSGLVPDDGVLNLGVSGFADFDFNGIDEETGEPHNEVGDYDLVLLLDTGGADALV